MGTRHDSDSEMIFYVTVHKLLQFLGGPVCISLTARDLPGLLRNIGVRRRNESIGFQILFKKRFRWDGQAHLPDSLVKGRFDRHDHVIFSPFVLDSGILGKLKPLDYLRVPVETEGGFGYGPGAEKHEIHRDGGYIRQHVREFVFIDSAQGLLPAATIEITGGTGLDYDDVPIRIEQVLLDIPGGCIGLYQFCQFHALAEHVNRFRRFHPALVGDETLQRSAECCIGKVLTRFSRSFGRGSSRCSRHHECPLGVHSQGTDTFGTGNGQRPGGTHGIDGGFSCVGAHQGNYLCFYSRLLRPRFAGKKHTILRLHSSLPECHPDGAFSPLYPDLAVCFGDYNRFAIAKAARVPFVIITEFLPVDDVCVPLLEQ